MPVPGRERSRALLLRRLPLTGLLRARTLEKYHDPAFLRAYTSFKEGKVVCEWESASKDKVVDAYSDLGFPYDEIVEVEAICDSGNDGVSTRYV